MNIGFVKCKSEISNFVRTLTQRKNINVVKRKVNGLITVILQGLVRESLLSWRDQDVKKTGFKLLAKTFIIIITILLIIYILATGEFS